VRVEAGEEGVGGEETITRDLPRIKDLTQEKDTLGVIMIEVEVLLQ
jgi:hypothetical protein